MSSVPYDRKLIECHYMIAIHKRHLRNRMPLQIDQKIADIVIDVAGGYFSGDKTLEDAAAQIQSRVNLYVHETL